MSVFDLKPLSSKTIDDLKIKNDQLWEIKIDDNFYGPFETQQLKHYSKENRALMNRAFVSPMSIDSWRAFFEVREFLHDSKSNGPYWLLSHGRKSSPLSKEEVAKRIELGTVTRHDEVSEDDGRHWHRISSHPEFEIQFTTATILPETPQESSFQKAKIRVLEQLEAKRESLDEKENLAGFTHASLVTKEKTRTVNVENIKLPIAESSASSFWENHKAHFFYATPVILFALYFSFSPKAPVTETPQIVEAEAPGKKFQPKRSKKDNWSRSPANDDSDDEYNRSSVTQPAYEDNYPTVIETHQEDQNYPDPEKEADQVAEIQDQEYKTEEHSLVQQPNRDPAQDGESLDATMNNDVQEPNPAVDQPVVEEVSDF
jgi:hypothetical protein